jgi:hypothetical protein
MIFGLEKKKLQNLRAQSEELSNFDSENLDTLIALFKTYTQVLKKLHSKEPNIFGNIHKYGLAELKSHKEIIKVHGNQENFNNFRNQIQSAIEDSLQYMEDYLHV